MIKHRYHRTLYGIIREMKLTTSLNFVLDAADKNSYDGSSQTWTDATGNGFNFFRGTDGTAQTSDPTFAGTAGLPSEATYFSFDGGDFFKQTAAHTFADAWHKDSGALTLLAVVYAVDAGQRAIFDTAGNTTDGILFRIGSNEAISFAHSTDNTTSETLASTATVTTSSWNFIACSWNEATPAGSLIINSTVEAMTSPSATTATDNHPGVIRIGADTDAAGKVMANGERLACIAGWSTRLSDANLTEIYKRLKYRRFTSMP